MTKRKIVIISIITLISAALVAVLVILGVDAHLNSKISYTVEDYLPDGEGKIARVILLGGQSNASGCSLDEYLEKTSTPQKYAEYKNGYDNVYINYFATGTNESRGFVKCATAQGEAGLCFGPELGMAEQLHEQYPDELFFIIKYAWGGSNLYDQWLSPSSFGKTGTLYRHFIKYVDTSIDYLVSKNYQVVVEGMCWMQGESDAFSPDNATDYEKHLKNFIKDLRRKYASYSSSDGIAFVDAYIADNPMFWVYYADVNAAKKKVADSSSKNLLVDTISLGFETTKEPEENPDVPHYDSQSEITLGKNFIIELTPFLD